MNRIQVLVVFLIALLRCALVPASAERDLETGTFLTRDPAGFVDGPNLYNYVGQNPWSRFDPDGLAQEFLDGTKVSYNQQSGYYVVERGSSIGPGPVNHAAANWMLNRGSSNPAVVDRHLRGIQKYDPYTIGAAMGDPVAQALLMGGGLPGGVGHDSNGRTVSPRQAGVRRYSGGVRVTTHEADTQNPGGKSAKTTVAQSVDSVEASSPKSPTEPYNRKLHYGRTPTEADRKAVGAGSGNVADHDPPLVKRYYEGDSATGEKPGYQMTPEERRASAGDRSRMNPQPRDKSNVQGAEMSKYSREKKKEHGLD